jgi:hypothetical protein
MATATVPFLGETEVTEKVCDPGVVSPGSGLAVTQRPARSHALGRGAGQATWLRETRHTGGHAISAVGGSTC